MQITRFAGLNEDDYLPAQLSEEEADLYCRLYSEDVMDLADNLERNRRQCAWLAIAVACAGVLAVAAWMTA